MLTRLSSTPAQGRELEQRKATGMVLQAQPICILLLLGKYNVPTLSRLPLLLNINLQSLLILVIIKRNKRDAIDQWLDLRAFKCCRGSNLDLKLVRRWCRLAVVILTQKEGLSVIVAVFKHTRIQRLSA